MIEDDEAFVYAGKGKVPWWLSGTLVPAQRPRDVRWDVVDGNSILRLTLDLRTLKLFARFDRLTPETERRIIERRGRRP